MAWTDGIKAFTTPGIVMAMTNTFRLAITRQAIALLIGAFFAWLVARTDIPMKGTLEFLFWLSFFLPALPETMGWILLLDPKYGLLNQGLIGLGAVREPLFNIYSFWGIVWAHLGGTVSVKVMLLAPAFRNLDAALEEASRISGASGWHTFFHIIVPVMMPAILVTTISGSSVPSKRSKSNYCWGLRSAYRFTRQKFMNWSHGSRRSSRRRWP